MTSGKTESRGVALQKPFVLGNSNRINHQSQKKGQDFSLFHNLTLQKVEMARDDFPVGWADFLVELCRQV